MADRYTIGKPHPDRAAQFKPFAALKGYYDLLEAEEQRENAQPERGKERHGSAQLGHDEP
ncbi:MAG: hypothetical protein Q4C41_07490 [Eggerthellaceae bacterium]|nr:hypothetical protein [Eggerthellaceae bacterium]